MALNLPNSQLKRWQPLVLVGLVLIGVAAVASFIPFGFGRKDGPVGTVKKGELVQRITVAGTIQPARKTLITPPYAGYVHKLYVKVGQVVKAGDPVVSLVQSLRQSGEPVFPMRAPFGGVVVQVNKSEGEYVVPTDPSATMVRIDDLSHLMISCEVPETNVTWLRPGQEVIIKPNSTASEPYKGEIKTIALAAKEGQWGRPGDRVNFDVKIQILNEDDRIRPGMSAIVDIITEKKTNVLTLGHEFIEKTNEDFFVTLANGERRKIQVGMSNEEAFEIIGGVKENEVVKLVDFYSLPPMP